MIYEYLQQKWNTDHEKAIMHNNQDADAIITTKSLITIFWDPVHVSEPSYSIFIAVFLIRLL